MNYSNDIHGCYITCIFTTYYYLSLCNITFLTSIKTLLQILCGCFLGGPLPRLLKSGSGPYFSWNLCSFWSIIKQSISLTP